MRYTVAFDIPKSLRATGAFIARNRLAKMLKSLIYIGAIASEVRSQCFFGLRAVPSRNRSQSEKMLRKLLIIKYSFASACRSQSLAKYCVLRVCI